MKRKAVDFTADYEIVIIQSVANRGKFWSQIVISGNGTSAWIQTDLSESRSGALSKAEDELDRLAQAWVDAEEPEEPYEDDRKNGAPESQFLYRRP